MSVDKVITLEYLVETMLLALAHTHHCLFSLSLPFTDTGITTEALFSCVVIEPDAISSEDSFISDDEGDDEDDADV